MRAATWAVVLWLQWMLIARATCPPTASTTMCSFSGAPTVVNLSGETGVALQATVAANCSYLIVAPPGTRVAVTGLATNFTADSRDNHFSRVSLYNGYDANSPLLWRAYAADGGFYACMGGLSTVAATNVVYANFNFGLVSTTNPETARVFFNYVAETTIAGGFCKGQSVLTVPADGSCLTISEPAVPLYYSYAFNASQDCSWIIRAANPLAFQAICLDIPIITSPNMRPAESLIVYDGETEDAPILLVVGAQRINELHAAVVTSTGPSMLLKWHSEPGGVINRQSFIATAVVVSSLYCNGPQVMNVSELTSATFYPAAGCSVAFPPLLNRAIEMTVEIGYPGPGQVATISRPNSTRYNFTEALNTFYLFTGDVALMEFPCVSAAGGCTSFVITLTVVAKPSVCSGIEHNTLADINLSACITGVYGRPGIAMFTADPVPATCIYDYATPVNDGVYITNEAIYLLPGEYYEFIELSTNRTTTINATTLPLYPAFYVAMNTSVRLVYHANPTHLYLRGPGTTFYVSRAALNDYVLNDPVGCHVLPNDGFTYTIMVRGAAFLNGISCQWTVNTTGQLDAKFALLGTDSFTISEMQSGVTTPRITANAGNGITNATYIAYADGLVVRYTTSPSASLFGYARSVTFNWQPYASDPGYCTLNTPPLSNGSMSVALGNYRPGLCSWSINQTFFAAPVLKFKVGGACMVSGVSCSFYLLNSTISPTLIKLFDCPGPQCQALAGYAVALSGQLIVEFNSTTTANPGQAVAATTESGVPPRLPSCDGSYTYDLSGRQIFEISALGPANSPDVFPFFAFQSCSMRYTLESGLLTLSTTTLAVPRGSVVTIYDNQGVVVKRWTEGTVANNDVSDAYFFNEFTIEIEGTPDAQGMGSFRLPYTYTSASTLPRGTCPPPAIVGRLLSSPLALPYTTGANYGGLNCQTVLSSSDGVVELISDTHIDLSAAHGWFAAFDGADTNAPLLGNWTTLDVTSTVFPYVNVFARSTGDSMLVWYYGGPHTGLSSGAQVSWRPMWKPRVHFCSGVQYLIGADDLFMPGYEYRPGSIKEDPYQPYPAGLDCWWRFNASRGHGYALTGIKTFFYNFEDTLTVYDEGMNGERIPTMQLNSAALMAYNTTRPMWLRFQSTNTPLPREKRLGGFKLSYSYVSWANAPFQIRYASGLDYLGALVTTLTNLVPTTGLSNLAVVVFRAVAGNGCPSNDCSAGFTLNNVESILGGFSLELMGAAYTSNFTFPSLQYVGAELFMESNGFLQVSFDPVAPHDPTAFTASHAQLSGETPYKPASVGFDLSNAVMSFPQLRIVGLDIHLKGMYGTRAILLPQLRSTPTVTIDCSLYVRYIQFGTSGRFLGAIYIKSMNQLQEIDFGRKSYIGLLSVLDSPIQTLDLTSVGYIGSLSISGSSLTLLNLTGTYHVESTVYLTANALLRSLLAPHVASSGVYQFSIPLAFTLDTNYQLSEIDLNAMSYVRLDVANTRLTALELPNLVHLNSMALGQNPLMTVFEAPNVRCLGAITLSQTSLIRMRFRHLEDTIYATITLTRNPFLEEFLACGMNAMVLTTSLDPRLSCRDLADMVATSRALGSMTPSLDVATSSDCDTTTSGTFGCVFDTVIFVNVTACGYTTACIQRAIDGVFTDHGLTLLIPAGRYTNCSSSGLDLRGKVFTLMGEGINRTIIDCTGSGRGLYAATGELATTVVSNITFMGGSADQGGVAYISGTSPTLTACAFRDSTAAIVGGGIAILNGASPVLSGCLIAGNVAAEDGGGVYVYQAAAAFDGVVVLNNVASRNGGGLALLDTTASTMIRDSFVSQNSAARGGGVYTDTFVDLLNVTIAFNTAADFGGGLAAVPDIILTAFYHVIDSRIHDNTAQGSGGGGGLFGYSANFILTGTEISHNMALTDNGGGVNALCSATYRILTGLVGACDIVVTVQDVVVVDNSAGGFGGGLHADSVMATIDDSSFSTNQAASGGAVYATTAELHLSGTLVESNAALNSGGGVYCEPFRASCTFANNNHTSNSALIAGGALYFCTFACPNASSTLTAADPYSLPDTSRDVLAGNSVARGGYGPDVATDPTRLTWAVGPFSTVVSGHAVTNGSGLTVNVADALDQTVTDTSNVLTLSLDMMTEGGEAAGTLISIGGSRTVLARAGVASFNTITLSVANTSLLNRAYTLSCSISEISAVTVTGVVQILPCGAGQGRLEASGVVVCDDCQPGYVPDSDLVCTACPVGSFAAISASTDCTPCDANTYAAQTGSSTCLACPTGFSAAAGSAVCVDGSAAAVASGLSSGSVVGIVVGVVVFVLLGICLAAIIFYGVARRRTMQKYYLDNDATIRTGTQESPLQKEVKRILLASSTTRIGGGLYSNVYKAKYGTIYIALKVVKGEMATNGTAQQEFRREAVALSRLEDRGHPGIVSLKFFLTFNPMCIGVAFCNGGSLKRTIAEKRFPSNIDKVRLAAEAASAFAVIHSCDIVHLDVKTDNMLLSDSGHLIVADFGIARILGMNYTEPHVPLEYQPGAPRSPLNSANSSLTAVGQSVNSMQVGTQPDMSMQLSAMLAPGGGAPSPVGSGSTQFNTMQIVTQSEALDAAFTPQYVDPYRLLYEVNSDENYLKFADVYSFAMMMWAIAAEQEPYAGEDPLKLIADLKDHPERRPPPISELSSMPFYADLMHRCWKPDPFSRPSFADIFATLRDHLMTDFGHALEPGYAEPSTAPNPPPTLGSAAVDVTNIDALGTRKL